MNGSVKIVLTCPQCGNSTWIPQDDGFECAACGAFSYTENMSSETEDQD